MSNAPNTQQNTATEVNARKTFSLWKGLLPVVIGLGVVALMFWHDSRKENLPQAFSQIHFTVGTTLCILLGFCFMMGRDFGLSWRFRALTDKELTWKQAFRVDWLCEFTSCVTPSAVGGSSLGMVFLAGEGIELGRATTLMITTLFLDELFFVIGCPIVILITEIFFPDAGIFDSASSGFTHGITATFWLVYAGIFLWTLILFLGIIVRPEGMRKVLVKLFSLRWLRRWQPSVTQLTDNMVATSRELKTKPFRFWLEVFGGTALSWTSRYLVVNALFLGFVPGADCQQWLIFARQFIMWVVLMVSPTPGGAGLSEWIFTEFYGNLVPTASLALILAIFWRIISYYVYLAIGAYVVPKWLRTAYAAFRSRSNKSSSKTNQSNE